MKRKLSVAFALVIALTLLLVQIASAHERRVVGKYQFVVGFLNEPAYLGVPNGIDLRVTNAETNKPVEGLEKTVKAKVIYGGKNLEPALAARFGQPGAYAGYFVPTKTGAYIFQFTGDVEGFKIDEKFESGPGRFGEPEDTSALQFPEKVTDPLELTKQVQAAQAAASSATTLGYVGIGVGVLGVILGALALRKK